MSQQYSTLEAYYVAENRLLDSISQLNSGREQHSQTMADANQMPYNIETSAAEASQTQHQPITAPIASRQSNQHLGKDYDDYEYGEYYMDDANADSAVHTVSSDSEEASVESVEEFRGFSDVDDRNFREHEEEDAVADEQNAYVYGVHRQNYVVAEEEEAEEEVTEEDDLQELPNLEHALETPHKQINHLVETPIIPPTELEPSMVPEPIEEDAMEQQSSIIYNFTPNLMDMYTEPTADYSTAEQMNADGGHHEQCDLIINDSYTSIQTVISNEAHQCIIYGNSATFDDTDGDDIEHDGGVCIVEVPFNVCEEQVVTTEVDAQCLAAQQFLTTQEQQLVMASIPTQLVLNNNVRLEFADEQTITNNICLVAATTTETATSQTLCTQTLDAQCMLNDIDGHVANDELYYDMHSNVLTTEHEEVVSATITEVAHTTQEHEVIILTDDVIEPDNEVYIGDIIADTNEEVLAAITNNQTNCEYSCEVNGGHDVHEVHDELLETNEDEEVVDATETSSEDTITAESEFESDEVKVSDAYYMSAPNGEVSAPAEQQYINVPTENVEQIDSKEEDDSCMLLDETMQEEVTEQPMASEMLPREASFETDDDCAIVATTKPMEIVSTPRATRPHTPEAVLELIASAENAVAAFTDAVQALKCASSTSTTTEFPNSTNSNPNCSIDEHDPYWLDQSQQQQSQLQRSALLKNPLGAADALDRKLATICQMQPQLTVEEKIEKWQCNGAGDDCSDVEDVVGFDALFEQREARLLEQRADSLNANLPSYAEFLDMLHRTMLIVEKGIQAHQDQLVATGMRSEQAFMETGNPAYTSTLQTKTQRMLLLQKQRNQATDTPTSSSTAEQQQLHKQATPIQQRRRCTNHEHGTQVAITAEHAKDMKQDESGATTTAKAMQPERLPKVQHQRKPKPVLVTAETQTLCINGDIDTVKRDAEPRKESVGTSTTDLLTGQKHEKRPHTLQSTQAPTYNNDNVYYMMPSTTNAGRQYAGGSENEMLTPKSASVAEASQLAAANTSGANNDALFYQQHEFCNYLGLTGLATANAVAVAMQELANSSVARRSLRVRSQQQMERMRNDAAGLLRKRNNTDRTKRRSSGGAEHQAQAAARLNELTSSTDSITKSAALKMLPATANLLKKRSPDRAKNKQPLQATNDLETLKAICQLPVKSAQDSRNAVEIFNYLFKPENSQIKHRSLSPKRQSLTRERSASPRRQSPTRQQPPSSGRRQLISQKRESSKTQAHKSRRQSHTGSRPFAPQVESAATPRQQSPTGKRQLGAAQRRESSPMSKQQRELSPVKRHFVIERNGSPTTAKRQSPTYGQPASSPRSQSPTTKQHMQMPSQRQQTPTARRQSPGTTTSPFLPSPKRPATAHNQLWQTTPKRASPGSNHLSPKRKRHSSSPTRKQRAQQLAQQPSTTSDWCKENTTALDVQHRQFLTKDTSVDLHKRMQMCLKQSRETKPTIYIIAKTNTNAMQAEALAAIKAPHPSLVAFEQSTMPTLIEEEQQQQQQQQRPYINFLTARNDMLTTAEKPMDPQETSSLTEFDVDTVYEQPVKKSHFTKEMAVAAVRTINKRQGTRSPDNEVMGKKATRDFKPEKRQQQRKLKKSLKAKSYVGEHQFSGAAAAAVAARSLVTRSKTTMNSKQLRGRKVNLMKSYSLDDGKSGTQRLRGGSTTTNSAGKSNKSAKQNRKETKKGGGGGGTIGQLVEVVSVIKKHKNTDTAAGRRSTSPTKSQPIGKRSKKAAQAANERSALLQQHQSELHQERETKRWNSHKLVKKPKVMRARASSHADTAAAEAAAAATAANVAVEQEEAAHAATNEISLDQTSNTLAVTSPLKFVDFRHEVNAHEFITNVAIVRPPPPTASTYRFMRKSLTNAPNKSLLTTTMPEPALTYPNQMPDVGQSQQQEEANSRVQRLSTESAATSASAGLGGFTWAGIKRLTSATPAQRNPLLGKHGKVLYVYYEQDVLIVVQEKSVSFWKYSKIFSVLRQKGAAGMVQFPPRQEHNTDAEDCANSHTLQGTLKKALQAHDAERTKDMQLKQQEGWIDLGHTRRITSDLEVNSPYANRICVNNATPVYVEMRCRPLEQNRRERKLLSTYVNVYYYSEEELRPKMHSVQLDTVPGDRSELLYTTIIDSRYFILAWPQESQQNKEKTGLCKYSLTPRMDTLASIREFKKMNYAIKHIECLGEDKLIGFGKTRITVWDHRSGDMIMDYDFRIELGENLGVMYYPSLDIGHNSLLVIYQHKKAASEGMSTELQVIACEISSSMPAHRLLQTHQLQTPQFDQDILAVNTGDHLILKSKENEEIWISCDDPQLLTFVGAYGPQCYYSRNRSQVIVLGQKTLTVDSIANHMLKLASLKLRVTTATAAAGATANKFGL